MASVQERLLSLRDDHYRAFRARLVPEVPKERVIGARAPALHALAKEIADTPDARAFLTALPHTYHDENILHAYLISGVRAYAPCVALVEAFLPFVDNWEVCDAILPNKAFAPCPPDLLARVRMWLHSQHTYAVRYGVGVLMRYYMDATFDPAYPAMVAAAPAREYYAQMMVAWYFATALTVRYEDALPYLAEGRLPVFVNNKAIQKAVESRCVPDEHKVYLKTLRRREPR